MVDFDVLKQAIESQGYVAEEELATTLYLALQLNKPILVEGAPGVGKTEIAKVLANAFGHELVRLQCYEGLDETKALYEWNYQRQLIRIQLAKEASGCLDEEDLFSSKYLLERPLLKAIRSEQRCVLLIDEIDKTDEEFEAFLFEVLSDFQVSIPEMGTVVARQVPIVILTSNGERSLSDGLKRRCVYLYIDYPTIDKELAIIRKKVPEAQETLVFEVVRAMHYLRSQMELRKKPAIAETIDWVKALILLGANDLQAVDVERTLSVILKNREDIELFKQSVGTQSLLEYAKQLAQA